jgi:hypothetical protein
MGSFSFIPISLRIVWKQSTKLTKLTIAFSKMFTYTLYMTILQITNCDAKLHLFSRLLNDQFTNSNCVQNFYKFADYVRRPFYKSRHKISIFFLSQITKWPLQIAKQKHKISEVFFFFFLSK